MLWTTIALTLTLLVITFALPQTQSSLDTDDENESFEEIPDNTAAEAQQPRAVLYPENYPYQNSIPIKQSKVTSQYRDPEQQQHQQQQIRGKQNYPQQFRIPQQEGRLNDDRKKEEEEEEVEEPDRLSLLLPNSKFECTNKNTGYYADEELNCEVFHYCNENAKHSWICPEGFTFHQVHLICMPPGADNICEKSSQYHFVNEYLYKPVNLEEYQRKPNVSLKYSERYYPEHIYQQDEYNDDEEQPSYRTSVRVKEQPQIEPVQRTTFRPETNIGQVFRSPNEVNIPLQQRRPQYVQRYFE